MNSAHQLQTVELTDADLDTVSGGVAPHASIMAGPQVVSDASLLAQAGAVQDQVLGAVGQYRDFGVSVSL
ncbi:hypothetical protein ACFW9D_05315 [Streptomyces sp. NPDC059524]|uniref:hypothetical protein n=1 Tax=Streptomyces sp. NPDC059524 TaxID=3346856 RepID=UPI0036D17D4F